MIKRTMTRLRLNAACAVMMLAVSATLPALAAGDPAPAGGISIPLPLPESSLVTLVIEDAHGNRVRNLIAETPLAAGENTVFWDGYDDGTRNGQDDLVRRRVPAGEYHLRGLTQAGVRMHYEMTVDNPGSPPWSTRDGSGGWLADHSSPADILFFPKAVTPPNGNGAASFLVCSTSAEAGSEFVWLDTDGRRLDGANDGFWGATHLTRDAGPKPDPRFVAYAFESGQRDPDNFNLEVRGFESQGGRLVRVLRVQPIRLPVQPVEVRLW